MAEPGSTAANLVGWCWQPNEPESVRKEEEIGLVCVDSCRYPEFLVSRGVHVARTAARREGERRNDVFEERTNEANE